MFRCRYPMVVGSMGMLASSIAAFIVCKVLALADSTVQVSAQFYCRHMIPVGVVMAITIWSGNLVYMYLTVSFTQMLKAAGPVFIMIAMFLAGLEKPTVPLIASVLTICGGLVVASAGEVHFHLLGVGVMLISEVGEATRLVLTQILLRDLQLGPLDGLLYLVSVCKSGLSHVTTKDACSMLSQLLQPIRLPFTTLGIPFGLADSSGLTLTSAHGCRLLHALLAFLSLLFSKRYQTSSQLESGSSQWTMLHCS